LAYAIPNFMAAAILDPHGRHKGGALSRRCDEATWARMNRLVALAVAAVVATLLWLNLDSGRITPEPASRFFSMPLIGLAAIFGVRAWTETQSANRRWSPFFAGLALGVGGYGIVRLMLV